MDVHHHVEVSALREAEITPVVFVMLDISLATRHP